MIEKVEANGKGNRRTALLICLCVLGFARMATAQLSPVWVARYAGGGDNSDKYNAIATDASGNFYLGGYSVRTGQQRDFLVAKTDANGDTLWMRFYNGTNNGDDEVNAIAVDASGNVYVTGYTDGDKSNFDFLTIKYDGSGNQLWAVTYNYSLAWMDDIAVGLAVDANGFVYVTGTSDASITTTANLDYATVCYNSSGVVQYEARKNGFGNDKDIPVAIAADNSGNCYVTGRSDSGNDDDYITIKYNSTGVAQWTKLYDGGNGDDRPSAMVLTPAGDVVVTGRRDAGANDDIVTISYSSAGVQLWQKNFNGSGNGNDRSSAIASDLSGNIYVTGESDADASFNVNYDFVTIKYTSNGTFSWASYYAGSGGGTDAPFDLEVDANGSVYVTGETDTDVSTTVNDDMVLVKYDVNGAQQWAQVIGGTGNLEDGGYGIVLDPNANPVIAGKMDYTGTQQDAALVKYDLGGNQVFLKAWNGEGDFSDNSFAVQTDQNGQVFAAGYTYVRDQNRDLLIRKYDSGGNVLKTFTYNGSKNDEDELADMVLDAAGNVYVTGFVKNSGSSSDFVTIKLDNNLDTSWVRFYNFSANESDKAVSIDVDGNGNVYVAGYSDNNPSDTIDSDDIVTIKYNANGSSQWTARYNSPAGGDERPVKVKADGNGNVNVAGRLWNGSSDDLVTVQYGPTGSQQWLQLYNGPGNGNDRAADLVLDNAGSVYVAGSGLSFGNFDDFVVVKYNQGGGLQWIQTYNGAGNDDDKASGIVLDAAGNVIVSGSSDTDTSSLLKNYDFLTVKYDNGGNFLWASTYAGSAGTDDLPADMSMDGAGNIYVAGESENGSSANPNKDFAVVGYRPDGSQFVYAIYDGPPAGTDGINAMAIAGPVLYVTGGSQGGISQKDAATIKYDIVSGIMPVVTHDGYTSVVYPHPASEYTCIALPDYTINTMKPVTLLIYNTMGERLELPFAVEGSTWKLDTGRMKAGIYYYSLNTSDGVIASGSFCKQ